MTPPYADQLLVQAVRRYGVRGVQAPGVDTAIVPVPENIADVLRDLGVAVVENDQVLVPLERVAAAEPLRTAASG
jgi:hypothetical protein